LLPPMILARSGTSTWTVESPKGNCKSGMARPV
jgi:hypothetical protein